MKLFKDMTIGERFELNKNQVYPIVGDCDQCDGYIVEVISGPPNNLTSTKICNKCGNEQKAENGSMSLINDDPLNDLRIYDLDRDEAYPGWDGDDNNITED